MGNDVQIILNTRGTTTRGGVALSPAQLARLPALAYQSLYETMNRLGTVLNFELKFYFYKMIHERPRNALYAKGRSTPLLQRMTPAFKYEVTGDKDNIGVNVFDLGHVDNETRGEGFNTKSKGWFMRFADGHSGRRHGGVGWGFAEYNFTMKLAEDAALLIGDDRKRMLWLMEMKEVFKGRHGEGIMVRLDLPLFSAVPEFGKAEQYIRPHPGFYSWPAIGMVGKEMSRRRGWVGDMIQGAFDSAVRKL